MRITLAISMIMATCSAFGQPSPAPAFDVVSVRPVNVSSNPLLQNVLADTGSCGRPNPKISGNRITVSVASLCGLIRFAYDSDEYRISGAPAWMTKTDQSQYFQVEAQTAGDGALDPDRAKEMFRALLADRFQLKVHRETKDVPVYNLVAAKAGPKLRTEPLSSQGICGAGPAVIAALPGRTTGSCTPNLNMEQLAYNLTRQLGRPVFDKTGLAGKYAFMLRWSPEGADPGPDAPAYIFTAIQEQLGLKLEGAKAPVELIVIDRAERPGTN